MWGSAWSKMWSQVCDDSVEWKGPRLNEGLVAERPRSNQINSQTTISEPVSIYSRTLFYPMTKSSMHAPINPMSRVFSNFQNSPSTSGDWDPEFSFPIKGSLQNFKWRDTRLWIQQYSIGGAAENHSSPNSCLSTILKIFPLSLWRESVDSVVESSALSCYLLYSRSHKGRNLNNVGVSQTHFLISNENHPQTDETALKSGLLLQIKAFLFLCSVIDKTNKSQLLVTCFVWIMSNS